MRTLVIWCVKGAQDIIPTSARRCCEVWRACSERAETEILDGETELEAERESTPLKETSVRLHHHPRQHAVCVLARHLPNVELLRLMWWPCSTNLYLRSPRKPDLELSCPLATAIEGKMSANPTPGRFGARHRVALLGFFGFFNVYAMVCHCT